MADWRSYSPAEAFYERSEQARKMREQCAHGKISLEEFNEWLED